MHIQAYLIASVTGITRTCFVLACFCSGICECALGMNIWDEYLNLFEICVCVRMCACVSLQYSAVTGALLSLWCWAWSWRQEDNGSSVGLWRSQRMGWVSYWVSSLSQEDLHWLISPCPIWSHQTHRAQWSAIKNQPLHVRQNQSHIINTQTMFTVLCHVMWTVNRIQLEIKNITRVSFAKSVMEGKKSFHIHDAVPGTNALCIIPSSICLFSIT